MKEAIIVILFSVFLLAVIAFGIGIIMATISLVEPWVGFLFERYEEWVEEIQKGLNQRKEKKKLIKEKLKELIKDDE